MTFPHEEFSVSQDLPANHEPPAPMPPESRPRSAYRSVVIALVVFLALAIGVIAALLWQTARSSSHETVVVNVGDVESADAEPSADASGARLVAWEKEIYPNPFCIPPLQNLIRPSASAGEWSMCETHTLGVVQEGAYAGWSLFRYVLTMENEMGGPTEVSFLMLTEPSDVPRMVRLVETIDQRSKGFHPIVFGFPENDNDQDPGIFAPIESALVAASILTARVPLPELDRFEDDRVMTVSNALDGVHMTLHSLGAGGNGNMEFSGDASRYFLANAVGTFADGTLVAPALDQRLTGAFIALRPDGRLHYYDALAPIFHQDEQYGYLGVQGTVDVRWDDGSALGLYTKSLRTGCGISAPVDVVSRVGAPPLRRTGTTLSGDAVYEYETLPDQYTWMQESWAYQQPEGADTSINAFLSIHPFFFWEDQMGRLLRFMRSDVVPMAECGKPVIYLYPETTMDVNVRLAPKGGFSKTEPEYGEGWNVTASPDGVLVNKADGKTYPYLFWEGTGGAYQSPINYDVVAGGDVEVYLRATLAKLGLNKTESADFLEFWLPRMQDAPYYKIGWHGKNVMDQLAPLSLSVRPDRIVRILMDFEELDTPIAAKPQIFRTPERKGFTVVAWGGVLR